LVGHRLMSPPIEDTLRIAVSHISRKTSEMWGTRDSFGETA
jgi:hypothetical protein